MKVQEVMTQHPLCCRATDMAQVVAQILREEDIGSIPVIEDGASKRLIGIITEVLVYLAFLKAVVWPATPGS